MCLVFKFLPMISGLALSPLLPSSDGQRGRPFRNHRQVVEGIAYRYRCGIAWRDLPEQFGPLWAEPEDHAIGHSRGGLGTKIHHACDSKGRPVAFLLGPGQGSDSRMFPTSLTPSTSRPDAVMGEKAYSSRANRSLLRVRKIKAVIPEPRDQIANGKRKGARGGRPVDSDSEAYKGRSVVEQSFNIFKKWRSIATRYDKLAITYRSEVALFSVLISLRQ